jgi:hypothetical protein
LKVFGLGHRSLGLGGIRPFAGHKCMEGFFVRAGHFIMKRKPMLKRVVLLGTKEGPRSLAGLELDQGCMIPLVSTKASSSAVKVVYSVMRG